MFTFVIFCLRDVMDKWRNSPTWDAFRSQFLCSNFIFTTDPGKRRTPRYGFLERSGTTHSYSTLLLFRYECQFQYYLYGVI